MLLWRCSPVIAASSSVQYSLFHPGCSLTLDSAALEEQVWAMTPRVGICNSKLQEHTLGRHSTCSPSSVRTSAAAQ